MTCLRLLISSDVFSLKLICYFFPYMGVFFFKTVLDKTKQIFLLTLFNIIALFFPGICVCFQSMFFSYSVFSSFCTIFLTKTALNKVANNFLLSNSKNLSSIHILLGHSTTSNKPSSHCPFLSSLGLLSGFSL